MNALQIKISQMATEILVSVVKGLENNFAVEADIVFEYALSSLEARLSPEEFVALCEEL